MAVRPLRVGVAGLGFGAAVHAPALLGMPGVELVGICGRDEARARDVARRLGVPCGTGDLSGLLDLGLDAVTLALPPDQAERAALAALGRGCAVLCEKPLSSDAASARAMASRAEGRLTAVDFQFAELRAFRRLRELRDEGVIGRTRHVCVTWLTESWAHRSRSWSWKTDAARGGGVPALFGSHLLYLAEWLLGPARWIEARLDASATAQFAPPGAVAAADLVHLRMEHPGGVIFSAVFGNANPGMHLHEWLVVGDRATLELKNPTKDYMRGFDLWLHGEGGGGVALEGDDLVETDGRIPPFRSLAARFLAALRAGETAFSPDFAAGARVQDLMAALELSASSGRPVAC